LRLAPNMWKTKREDLEGRCEEMGGRRENKWTWQERSGHGGGFKEAGLAGLKFAEGDYLGLVRLSGGRRSVKELQKKTEWYVKD